jgi:ankyrin repeat protein
MLVSRNAKLHALNKCEDTPLHCAVQNNHAEVACLLIRHKADLNAYNIHGNTPLHYACHFGFADLCFELIRQGASVNCCNRYNSTPTDLCRRALRELLLNVARSYDLPTEPVAFRESAVWRMSRNKPSKTAYFK